MPLVELRGLSALEAWTRKATNGYKDVKVHDLSTSWRDGLAFCALIHHFRPDLIDFDSLSKENILYNNRLAFQIAEKHLGVPALLDAEDMFKHEEPDRLSVATYLSQFYECFEGSKSGRKHSITTNSSSALVSKKDNSFLTNINCKTTAITTANTTTITGPTGAQTDNNSINSNDGGVDSCNISATITPIANRPVPPKRDIKCHKCRTRVSVLDRLIVDDNCYHKSCYEDNTIEGNAAGNEKNLDDTDSNDSHTKSIAPTHKTNDALNTLLTDKTDNDNNNEIIYVNDINLDVNTVRRDENESPVTLRNTGRISEVSVDSISSFMKTSDCHNSDNNKSDEKDRPISANSGDILIKSLKETIMDLDNDVIDSAKIDAVFDEVFGEDIKSKEDIEKSRLVEPKNRSFVDYKDIDKVTTDEDIYPDDKNPFDDEECNDIEDVIVDKSGIKGSQNNNKENEYPDDKNPFGDDDDEDNDKVTISKGNGNKVAIKLRSSSDALNPFAEDEDNEDLEDASNVTPKPRPRKSLFISSPTNTATSSPTSSLKSRKKRPAPTPPVTASNQTTDTIPQVSSTCSLSTYGDDSFSSRRDSLASIISSELTTASITSSVPNSRTPTPLPRKNVQRSGDELSDGDNQSDKNKTTSPLKNNESTGSLRGLKKRPAPPIPAIKRMIKGSLTEIEDELNSIGDKLPVIEKKTQELEQILISRMGTTVGGETPPIAPKDDPVLNEFLATARERCRLARRQKELMYMKREHKLEEIQADIEYQMRCVISKQSAQKTDEDLKREEELLQRLMEIIEERNDIVENMIKDENKEVEEYQKLVSKVLPSKPDLMPKPKPSAYGSHSTTDQSFSGKLSKEEHYVKLKNKLKLKDIKEKKRQKKLEKLEKSAQKSDKSDDKVEDMNKTTDKSSTKHMTLKSTLKPLKKFSLKSLTGDKVDKKTDKQTNGQKSDNITVETQ
ncbi:MICAL-like protein 1 [Oppia nitens]|uniref:MICAL-like protein 1 n=1 Tax=Oppia nitens TaxID=1686743 RepID=UPI0023DA52A8|nr:MICAL-like protein 1 [Oppia nitens]